ncbi:hypothetical protein [Nostoc sp. PA-18-2419]|nr:hypothetical protein [Nostoc sp. PA-18-2419]
MVASWGGKGGKSVIEQPLLSLPVAPVSLLSLLDLHSNFGLPNH